MATSLTVWDGHGWSSFYKRVYFVGCAERALGEVGVQAVKTVAKRGVMAEEEHVVTVEVDVKAEEEATDARETEEPQAEGGETAATSEQPEQEEKLTKQDGEDSGSEDEQTAAGKTIECVWYYDTNRVVVQC